VKDSKAGFNGKLRKRDTGIGQMMRIILPGGVTDRDNNIQGKGRKRMRDDRMSCWRRWKMIRQDLGETTLASRQPLTGGAFVFYECRPGGFQGGRGGASLLAHAELNVAGR